MGDSAVSEPRWVLDFVRAVYDPTYNTSVDKVSAKFKNECR